MSRTNWWSARRLAATPPVLPPISRPLAQAAGCVLAADIRSLADLPPVDTAAMDGFAVAGPGPWSRIGQILAGDRPDFELMPGTAAEIATGAPVPAGASAVIAYEESASNVDGRLTGALQPGRHIRRRGSDCADGELLIPAGAILGPIELAVAASGGVDEMVVRPRPRVQLLITGDELCRSGAPRSGRIRDALGPLLPGMIAALGARCTEPRYLPDDPNALEDALSADGFDIHVVTGASSVGPADHVHKVIAAEGARVVVDGVDCRPGHPQLLAERSPGWLVGLPGNPMAAVVGVMTLLAPLVQALAGRPVTEPVPAALSGVRPEVSAGTRLRPARLDTAGKLMLAAPAAPSSLRPLLGATHLAVFDASDDGVFALTLPGIMRP